MSAQGRRDSLPRSIDTSETRVPPSLARVSPSLPGHPSSRFGCYLGGLALVTAVPGKACFAGSWDEVEGVLCLVAYVCFRPKADREYLVSDQDETEEVVSLKQLNGELSDSLGRCRDILRDYRERLATTSNLWDRWKRRRFGRQQ
jgi:hypothetical protein